ncbi:MAG: hypothetical protein QOI78_9549 [Actinomycetota bacterium]|nr:hypothetical protein [Actinomycetota bacterium]
MRRADTGFRWGMTAPEAFATKHPPLRLLDERSAVDLIGGHQTGAAARATRALAHVPPGRDAMRFPRATAYAVNAVAKTCSCLFAGSVRYATCFDAVSGTEAA